MRFLRPPFARVSWGIVLVLLSFATAAAHGQAAGTALVRLAVANSGTINGSVQQIAPENVTFNGGAVVTGDYRVPGTPTVRLNGKPSFGGVVDETGTIEPTNYQVTLNGNVRVGRVVRRVNPVSLPTVAAPPTPTGTRSVTLSAAGQNAGDFSTLRHLTLNGNVGQVAVPPGTYGDFTANAGAGFTLGAAGATQPSVYHFQRLTLNGQSQFQVLGPVIVTVANGFTANGTVGSSAQPARLTLNIYSGGLTLNGGSALHGYVNAPRGTVTINGNSQLIGGVACDRLVVNGNGLLRLQTAPPTNQPPVAHSQSLAIDEDTAASIVLTGADLEGAPLTFTIVTPPQRGTLVAATGAAGGPAFTYTPQANYHGADAFTFKVGDGALESAAATVALTIRPVNDAPVADAKTVPAFNEDTSTAIVLTGSDVEGSPLTFSIHTAPQHGTLSGTPPSLTYTPAANFHGADSFTYRAHDGQEFSAPAAVSLSILPVNDAPVAASLTFSGLENTNIPVALSATDVDGDPLTYAILVPPAHGTLTGTPPNLVYRSTANFGGTDSFTYRASDGTAHSAPATVTLAIGNPNDPPAAIAQSLQTPEDTAKPVTLAGTDPDGDALTFDIVTLPQHGTLSGTGALRTYSPAPDYHGADQFTFRAFDGEYYSNPATVSLEIQPVNDAPVAIGQARSGTEDTPLTLTLAGTDIENSPLTFTIVTPPQHGVLAATADAPTPTSRKYVYTPAADYHGPDTFTFRVNDGSLDSAPATVSLTIAPVNDAPVAAAQTATTPEDTPLTLTLGGTDIEGSPLVVTIVSPPQHGSLTPSVSPATSPFAYVPNANYHGPDSFSFRVNDGELDSAATATVTLTITPVNDAPVAASQSVTLPENTTLALTLGATDADNDVLTFAFTTPAHGSLTGTAPNLTYTPQPNYFGADSFTFTATDPSGAQSNVATIAITVLDVNTPPVAANQTVELDEDTPATFTLAVSDADGDALAYTLLVPPAHGALTGFPTTAQTAVPSLTYTPAADFSRTDTFRYRVADGSPEPREATVTLIVRPVNDAPVPHAQAIATPEDVPVAVLLSGSDAENQQLTFTVVTQPSRGTLSGTAPHLTYTPAPDVFGSDSFTFKVSDGALDSAPSTVAIAIAPVNDAPVAVGQSLATDNRSDLPIQLIATDADGDALVYTTTAGPNHGTLSGSGGNRVYRANAGFVGNDSFSFSVADAVTSSASVLVSISVSAAINRPPIVNAGSDAFAGFGPTPDVKPFSNIVLNHDEWTLTESGFAASPYAGQFARNVASWFTGGRPGRFLAYTKTIPGSVGEAFTGPSLRAALESAGHTWVTSDTIAMTLENLKTFDAVFLCANEVDNQVLIDYVNAGGSVYISAGTKWCGCDADVEAGWWNPFLNAFGLGYGFPYNLVGGTLPVDSAHPIFDGIPTLYYGNGNPVLVLNPNDPRTTVINRYQGKNLLALYSSRMAGTIALNGTATDDGLLTGSLTYAWTKVSGPHVVVFEDSSAAATQAIFGGPGVYQLRLTVSDGEFTVTDDIAVAVEPNDPPRVYAGGNTAIRSFADVFVPAATVTDDGVPRGSNSTVCWRVVNGPGAVTFSNAQALRPEVRFSVNGFYVLELSATDGQQVARSLADVRVGMPAPETPEGIAAWWPGNSYPHEIVRGGHDFVFSRAPSYAAGRVGDAFSFSGTTWAETAPHADLDIGTSSAGVTVEFWARPAEARNAALLHWATETIDGFGIRQWDGGSSLLVWNVDTAGTTRLFSAPNVFSTGTWVHVAYTYDRVSGWARIFRNGVIVAEQYLGSFALRTAYNFFLAAQRAGQGMFSGQIDELSLYRRALAASEISAIYASGAAGKCSPDDNLPPIANAGPDIAVVGPGNPVTLTGSVTDDGKPLGPVVVQWSVVSGPGVVSFANAATAVTTATFGAPGVYQLKLVADDGLTLPASDMLEVRVASDTPEAPAGVAAWWPGNGHSREIVAGHRTLELINGAGYTTGQVLEGFAFDGIDDYAYTPAHSDLNVGTSAAGFTIEFWTKPGQGQNAAFLQWAGPNQSDGTGIRQWDSGPTLYAWTVDTAGVVRLVGVNNYFTAMNVWYHVAFTYDRVSGVARIYRNGLLIKEQNIGSLTLQTSYDFILGASRRTQHHFKGEIDEVTLYRRPLAPAEVAVIHAAGVGGKNPPDDNLPPVVHAGPDRVLSGSSAAAVLSGSVTDDGLPFGLPTVLWTKLEGPGEVVFGSPNQLQTTASFAAPGTYLLQLTARDGLTSPVSDRVEVRVGIALPEAPADLVAWWPANGDARDVVSGARAVELVNGPSYAPGHVVQSLAFDGVDDYGRVSAHPDLDIGAGGQGFTVEFWARPGWNQNATLVGWTRADGVEGLGFKQWDGGPTFYAWTVDTAGTTRLVGANGFFSEGVWTHVGFVYDRTSGFGRIYRNGILVKEQNIGSISLQTAYDLYFGATTATSGRYRGQIDEVSFYRRPLAPAELAAIHLAGVGGKAPPDDNLPPTVTAGPDIVLPSVGSVATLNGSISDDGRPFGAPTAQWSVVAGPGSVTFSNSTQAQTTATFSVAGAYLLRLAASDGYSLPAADHVEVRVGTGFAQLATGIAAWWPANGEPREVINGNHDFELANGAAYTAGYVLQGLAFDGTDDYARIPAHADLDIGASAAGFTIEFWTKPGWSQNSAILQWTRSDGAEGMGMRQWDGGPTLLAWTVDSGGITRLIGANGFFTQDIWTHVAFAYDRVAGIGRIYRNGVLVKEQSIGSFAMRTGYDLYMGASSRSTDQYRGALDEVSLYSRPLTGSEIAAIHAAASAGKLPPVVNQAPVASAGPDASGTTGIPIELTGTATDDGLPNPPGTFTYAWSRVSGPGGVAFSTPNSASTSATFDTAGTHVVRLTVSDSVLSATDDVTVTVTAPASQPPTIAFTEPSAGASLPAGVPFELVVRATDPDGTIAKVEFFQGTAKLGEQTQPEAGNPTSYFWLLPTGLSAGSYTFTAKATDNSGVSATSAPLSLNVVADPGPPVATISTPAEDARVTQPIALTGITSSPLLTGWKLERRLKAAEGAPAEAWVQFATGTTAIGAPASGSTAATPGTLGTFDPTSLLNGIYEIRLTATDSAGRTVVDGPITLLVEGNIKTGAFSLAFEDLKVPVAGIPITLTRTYDSRDPRIGDFGPGWRLALNNIRVQKNRHLGTGWWQTPQQGQGLQFYVVEPLQERIVSVVMPDGESHRFRAGAYVKVREGDPDNASFGVVVREGKFRFYPIGDTTSKLEPLNSSNELYEDFWLEGTGDQNLNAGDYGDIGSPVFNATRFRLTTADGTVFILDEALGLLEMRDLDGNTLTLTRDAQDRVSGIVSQRARPSPNSDLPSPTTVTIVRDATGRVDYIRDPAGKDLDYLYDPQGRLASFTDREGNITQFRYERSDSPTHPQFHYLTRIIDPRGIAALRSEYDPDTGKLIKQIDADGRETVFTRGIDGTGRFEKVKDRLGHETTFYYDERGNVTLKIDPLGAQTSYAYWPDSDRVKFETDHYGNVKAMAYDARGNVIVETLGARTDEDPANPTTGFTSRTSYNDLSAPTQMTDADGRVQSFAYDPATNNLLTHTLSPNSQLQSATTYTYNADGTLATTTDALGNVTSHTYAYDFSDPAFPGAVKQVTATATDPAGAAGSDPANTAATVLRVTRTLFDAQENQLAQIVPRTLADGSTENVVTRYRYDAENRLRATILPDGRVTETRYTSFGKEEKSLLWRTLSDFEAADDTKARVTTHGYDARGNLTSTTYADGTRERMSFDLENRKLWSEDPRGYRTFFVYDAVGRLRFTIHPDENDGVGDAAPTLATDAKLADNPRTETQYDLIGRVRFQIDERGAKTEFTYEDNCGCALRRKETIQHRAAGNLVTTYGYDKAGNVRFVTDPRGNVTETRYDDHGRPTVVVHPATDEHPATQTETKYDALGRRVAAIDQEGKLTRYRYDGLGRLIEVRQYLDQSLAASDASFELPSTNSGVVATRYAYDELGSQTAQIDALGRTTTYATDALGRRTQRTLPKDAAETAALSEILTYDEWGNLWKRTDFAGKTTTFGYDALNRLKSKAADPTHPSLGYSHAIARIEYDYDANGARTAARTFNASATPLYAESTPRDARGRIDYKDTGASGTGRLDYSYHANGLLKDVVSSNAGGVNLGYRYDELNRLEAVDDTSTGLPVRTSGYTYNANGSLETLTQPNGVVHTYGYDALNRLRGLVVSHGTTLLHTYEYKLRASGHRREVVEGAKTTTYGYDELYRLANETVTGDASGQNGTIGYTLDKVGNRSSRQSSLPAVSNQTLTYNARDWLDGDTYTPNGSTVTGHLAPITPGPSPDVSGTDTYDFEERLIVRTRADGSTVNVSYNADGIRIAKNILSAAAVLISSTTWAVDTNNLTGYAQVVEERITTPGPTGATTAHVYTYGTSLLSRVTTVSSNPGIVTLRYYAADGHGNTRELTDAAGTITDRYTYDAFGKLVSASGPATSTSTSSFNSYLYCGEQFDADLSLYYLRARYLSPDSGRFWSSDVYPGSVGDPASLHKYNYAGGNPVSGRDPSGYMTLTEAAFTGWVIGTVSGITFGGTTRFLSAYQNGARGWELAAESVYGAAVGGIVGGGIGATFAVGHAWLAAKGFTMATGTIMYGGTGVGLVHGSADGFAAYVEYELGSYYSAAGNAISAVGGFAFAGFSRLLAPKFVTRPAAENAPSAFARSLQGSGNYPGVDRFKDIVLKKDTIIFGGAPGQSNFYTTASAVRRSGGNADTLFQGLQVGPHPVHGYRPGVTAYRVLEDSPAAFGRTLANPQHGSGRYPQIVLEGFETKLEPLYSIPLRQP